MLKNLNWICSLMCIELWMWSLRDMFVWSERGYGGQNVQRSCLLNDQWYICFVQSIMYAWLARNFWLIECVVKHIFANDFFVRSESGLSQRIRISWGLGVFMDHEKMWNHVIFRCMMGSFKGRKRTSAGLINLWIVKRKGGDILRMLNEEEHSRTFASISAEVSVLKCWRQMIWFAVYLSDIGS